jgi:nucleoid DNA-binding protein
MTKRDLVIRIAKETDYKQQDVMEVIQHALDIIVDQLATGQGLEFRNFGVFEVLVRKQRIGAIPTPRRRR